MFCTNCGKQINTAQNFCTNCGKPVASTTTAVNQKTFFEKYISRGGWKFFGSTLAIVIGVIEIGVGASNPSGQPSAATAGWVIILGALAYKSAKKTKMGLVRSSPLRLTLEIVALLIAMALVLGQSDIGDLMYNDPFPNVIIPLWVLLAYVIVRIRNIPQK